MSTSAPSRLSFLSAANVLSAQEGASFSYLVEAICESIEQDEYFDSWIADSDDADLPHLLRGATLLKRAWIYRGGGRGEEVTEDRFDRMGDALEKSLDSTVRILEHDAFGSEASARTIRTLMGLRDEWDELDEVHDVMRGFDKPNFFGELNYLIASCEKWLGSHEKMFDFARSTTRAFPDHPAFGALVAAAHWERHMHYERFEENEELAATYLTNKAVLMEVTSLSKRLLSEPSKEPYSDLLAHNIFAAFFGEADQYELARPHFNRIGHHIMRYPWEFCTKIGFQIMRTATLNIDD